MRESRERRMAFRELRERVERDVLALEPVGRGRGLAWFRTADGTLDHRFTLQLPPLETLTRWDDRPYVSPLAEVAGRGRPAGLVLVSAEAVRLLHWQDGRVTEPAPSLYEIEPGQWRDYDAPAARPMAGTSPSSASGSGNGGSASCAPPPRRSEPRSPGWAGSGSCWPASPALASGRVIATVDANLIWEDHAAVAERLDDALRDAALSAGADPRRSDDQARLRRG
jgi:hypothetical protein